MSVMEVAGDHQAARAVLISSVSELATAHWAQLDPGRVEQAWSPRLPQLLAALAGAQLAAAGQAENYLDAVLTEQDLPTRAEGVVVAAALAGVASDGRPLSTLLLRPAVATRIALAGGAAGQRALATGLAVLQMIVTTQVSDAGRVADQVATSTRRAVAGYVRMPRGSSCPRCAVLAGRWYRWSAGFRRHPRCDCIHIPTQRQAAGALVANPRRLITAGRVVGLSRAQRQAIDTGADPAQVINAARGMYFAGERAFTTESTTRRGVVPNLQRLMPEQILREAADRDDAIRLLRLHGYLL